MIQHMHATAAQPQSSANNVTATPLFLLLVVQWSAQWLNRGYCSGTLKGVNSIEHHQIVQGFTPSRVSSLGILASSLISRSEPDIRCHFIGRLVDVTQITMQAILKSTTAFLSLTTSPTDRTSLSAISPSCGRIDLFGVKDGRVDYGQKTFAGGVWSEWTVLSGLGLTYKTPPKALIARPGTMDVFVTSINGTLHVRHFDGNSWSPADSWATAFNGVEDTGSVVSHYEGRADVFTRRADDSRLMHIYKHDSPDNKYWGYAFFPEYPKAPPAAVIPGPYKAELLWIGTDDYVHHWHRLPRTWAPEPTTLGTQKVSSSLTVVSNAEGRVDLFALAPDRSVVHNSYQDAAGVWTGWETLGGSFRSSISAVVRKGSNTIELFGLGSDNAFWHRAGNGTHWPATWVSHRGGFKSAPTLVSSCPGEYDVFGIGNDRKVYNSHWSETAGWTPSVGQWTPLGGSFQDFP